MTAQWISWIGRDPAGPSRTVRLGPTVGQGCFTPPPRFFAFGSSAVLATSTVGCQTAPMSYHEQLWVVIGTAAPVIGLSVIVIFSRGLSRTASYLGHWKTHRGSLPYWVTAIGTASAFVCLADQGILLVIALRSLAIGHDIYPVESAIDWVVFGIVLLAGLAFGDALPQLGPRDGSDSGD